MTANLTGPRLDPKGGPARQLVVFLHGYGADGNDLIELGGQWRALMPRPPSSRRTRPSAAPLRRWAGNGSP